MRKLILLLSLLTLLGACAIKKTQVSDTLLEEKSHPSYSSIYFFTVGSYFEAQGNFPVADMLYQKALNSDSGSIRIRRQVLLNSFNLYGQGAMEERDLRNLISGARELIEADPSLIYATYEFYDAVGDTLAMDKATKLLCKKFPSPQADIQRFTYEYKYTGKPTVSLLDSAYAKAQNEPRSLYVLSNIFPYFKPEMVRPALWRYYEIDPSTQSRGMLALHIAESGDLELARMYLATLTYPEDRLYIAELADELVFSQNPSLLVELRAEIVATKDADLIHSLALASLLVDRYDVLEDISKMLPELPAPETDKQELYSLLIGASLGLNEQQSLQQLTSKLQDTGQFDNILAIYNLSLTRDFNTGWAIADSVSFRELIKILDNRMGDTVLTRYLKAVAIAVRDSLNPALPTVKSELILDLKTRTVLTEKDYEFLMNYYYSQKMYAQRRELLTEAQSTYPDNPLFCNDLGYYYLSEGQDSEQAARLIRRALAVEPENPFYLDSFAWYHYLQGDYQKALELTALPLQMENMPSEIAWHIGAIFFRLEDYVGARKYLKLSIDTAEDPDISAKAEQLLNQIP